MGFWPTCMCFWPLASTVLAPLLEESLGSGRKQWAVLNKNMVAQIVSGVGSSGRHTKTYSLLREWSTLEAG